MPILSHNDFEAISFQIVVFFFSFLFFCCSFSSTSCFYGAHKGTKSTTRRSDKFRRRGSFVKIRLVRQNSLSCKLQTTDFALRQFFVLNFDKNKLHVVW